MPWYPWARDQLALFGNWLAPKLNKAENDERERPTIPAFVCGEAAPAARGGLNPEFANPAVTWDHTLAISLSL